MRSHPHPIVSRLAARARAPLVCALLVLVLGGCATTDTMRGAHEPRPVGFRSWWELDASRTWRTTFDDEAVYAEGPRPVLVHLWYPARSEGEAPAMRHADYFELPPLPHRPDSTLPERLGAYAREVAREQLGANTDELFSAPLPGIGRDLPPGEGPFPLVVYHAGAGSSFEDDAGFCTRLARHGYVVAGSAFLEEDGSSLGTDGRDASVADLRLLVERVGELPFVDATRVGFVGHSLGAQAILLRAATDASPGDAYVLFDSTLDYYGLHGPLNVELVRTVLERRAEVRSPLLFAAGPEAMFLLADRLDAAERVYLTLPELGHDEYLRQGLQRLELEGDDRAEAVRREQRALEDVAVAFLDAWVRDAPVELAHLLDELEDGPLADGPSAVAVPVGTNAPPRFEPAGDRPPTPRQMPRLLAAQGADELVALVDRYADREPLPIALTSSMLRGSLVYELLVDGRDAEARAVFEAFERVDPGVLSFFLFQHDFARLSGREAAAAEMLGLATKLAPEDPRVAERSAR